MKKINIIKIILLLITFSFVACQSSIEGEGFENDPDNVNDAPAVSLLGKAELVVSYLVGSDVSRYAGINSGYINGTANQFLRIKDYEYLPQDFESVWNNMYAEGIKSAKLVKSKAIETNDLNLLGSAQLLEALFFGELAVNFGDVPFTDVFNSDIVEPSYDNQIVVIQGAIDLLDEAISNAGSENSYFNDGIGNLSTTSNISNIAHSLKARYYLALKDYPNALIEAQQGITSTANNFLATFKDSPNAQNYYFQFLVQQRNGETGPSGSYLEALIDNTNTSVTRSLDTPGDDNRYAFYYVDDRFNETSSGIFAPDASIPVISWYETKLIVAEAAQRTGNNPLALSALNEVRVALTAEFGGSFPPSTATGNVLLGHILEEKYISIFPASQSFNDITRTNNLMGVPPYNGSQLPQRFLYSQGEIDTNSNIPNPLPTVFDSTNLNN